MQWDWDGGKCGSYIITHHKWPTKWTTIFSRSLHMQLPLRTSYFLWAKTVFPLVRTYQVTVWSIGSVAESVSDSRDWLEMLLCGHNSILWFSFYSDIQKGQISTRHIWGTLYDREASECTRTKTSQDTSALHPFICFSSLIALIWSILEGSISKDSWSSREERSLRQTRGWLQPRWIRIRRRAALFPERRGPTKLPRRSAGLPWWKCAFPNWTQNWSTLQKSEDIHFIVNVMDFFF